MKLVKESLINEKFTEDSDPIKDMGIGFPEYNIFYIDDHDEIEDVYKQLKKMVRKLGLSVRIDTDAVYISPKNFKNDIDHTEILYIDDGDEIETMYEKVKTALTNLGFFMYIREDENTGVEIGIISKGKLSEEQINDIMEDLP